MRLAALLAPCVAFGLAIPTAAQAVGAAATAAKKAVGLRPADGGVEGFGPTYRARFTQRGFAFTAHSGPGGQAAPMHFLLESYGRLGGQSVSAGGAAPVAAGDTVRFARAGVLETYELRPEGVEQSFTFATLPHGPGDLVVRLAVATDLEPSESGRRTETLQFTSPELGAVHIGRVTGIDASGARADGWMSYRGGILELGLPAAFVDSAALPLVLDPLVAGTTFVGMWGHYPDAAYDETNNVFLVVWQGRTGSMTTSPNGIFCQRLRPTGVLVGSITTLATTTNVGRPKVTNVNSRDAFVVSWREGGSMRLASVLAGTGAVVSRSSTGDGAVGDPAIGGVSSLSGDTAILYWSFRGMRMNANTVRLGAGGALTVSPSLAPAYASTALGSPSISRAGGDWRRQLLTWEDVGHGAGNKLLRGTVVNNQGVALTPTIDIASASSTVSLNAAIDGDGANWVVSHQKATGTSTARGQIVVRPVRLRAALGVLTLALGTPVTLSSHGDSQDPKVAWMGSSALVGWSSLVGNTGSPNFNERFRTEIASIDPFSCLDCETPPGPARFYDPDTSWQSGQSVAAPALCSTLSGTTNQARQWASLAVVAWSFADHGLLGVYDRMDIGLSRFRADDGAINSLGGACANGGIPYSSCGIVGNPNFVQRLRFAAPMTPAFLLLGTNALNAPCGTCTFIPNPLVTVSAGRTNAFGEAQVTFALPNFPALRNSTLLEQWLLFTPSTPPGCALFNLDLSNALVVTLQ